MATTAPSKRGKRSPSPRLEKFDKQDMEALRLYVRNNAERFLRDPNITSIGLGHRIRNGKRTGEVTIQFTVGKKVEPGDVAALHSQLIPDTLQVGPKHVPTDVFERSYKPAYIATALPGQDKRKERLDPITPGASVGNTKTSAGTIGCFVRERKTSQTVLLSNWHVLHGPDADIGIDVVQPGKADDNRTGQNKVGKLLRSFIGPAGDCAIASVTARDIARPIMELGSGVTSIAAPEFKDRVVKSGRTTGITRGRVSRLEVNTTMHYAPGCSAVIGGFEIEPDPAAPPSSGHISSGGDSGSVWLACDAKGKTKGVMLGLHFGADENTGENALACYAKSVMMKLDIEPLGAKPQSFLKRSSDLAAGGFDRAFLAFHVEPPAFSPKVKRDLARVDGNVELTYCHFSAWQSKSRKYPRCVAWNVDGSSFKRITPIPLQVHMGAALEPYQWTDGFYSGAPCGRARLAPREDLCWGTHDEARRASDDSSFYSNVIPFRINALAHDADALPSHPDSWGQPENMLLDAQTPHHMRFSVIAGPVFGKNDDGFSRAGNTCRIPDAFWKVVAYVDRATMQERVVAMLFFARIRTDLAASDASGSPEAWVWGRISLEHLEAISEMKFAKTLHQRERRIAEITGTAALSPVTLVADPAALFA